MLFSLPCLPALPQLQVERMCSFRTEAWLQASFCGKPQRSHAWLTGDRPAKATRRLPVFLTQCEAVPSGSSLQGFRDKRRLGLPSHALGPRETRLIREKWQLSLSHVWPKPVWLWENSPASPPGPRRRRGSTWRQLDSDVHPVEAAGHLGTKGSRLVGQQLRGPRCSDAPFSCAFQAEAVTWFNYSYFTSSCSRLIRRKLGLSGSQDQHIQALLLCQIWLDMG